MKALATPGMYLAVFLAGALVTVGVFRWHLSTLPVQYLGAQILQNRTKPVSAFSISGTPLVVGLSTDPKDRSLLIGRKGESFPACLVRYTNRGITEVVAINSEQHALTIEAGGEKGAFTGYTVMVPSSTGETRVMRDDGMDGVFDKDLSVPTLSLPRSATATSAQH